MRKRILLFLSLFFILISSISYAQNESPMLETAIFDAQEKVLPMLPEEAGQFTIELYDSITKQPIKDSHVVIEFIDKNNKKYKTILFLGDSNVLKLPYQKDLVSIILSADTLNTEGSDYYARVNDISNNTKAYLVPAGSVLGKVIDSKDNAVPAAKISFLCAGGYDLEDTYSDDFGNFKAVLPKGNCRISAANSGVSGYNDAVILQGQQTILSIKLQTKIASKSYLLTFLAIALIIVIVLLVIVLKKNKAEQQVMQSHHKPETLVEHKEDTAIYKTVGKRAQDIMKTLSPKEKEIVELLLMHKSLSQANISWKTGIPKTTLARLLDMLQHKKIIEISQEGKLKKVTLSSWFLEKE